ncbi:MAG: DUF3592 domain-containing protein [Micropruina sp.]
MIEAILYFLKTTPSAAQVWAEQRGVPCWIQELPGGWVLLRSAAVDGLLVGSLVPPEAALVEFSTMAAETYLMHPWVVLEAKDGEVCEFDGDQERLPWDCDDDRQVRGLLALSGDRSAELQLRATAADMSFTAVVRDGWTLIPHDDPSMAAEVFGSENPSLALLRVADELHLWLVDDGDPIAAWEWSVQGSLVAIDRLPAGDVGDEIRDILYAARDGIDPFMWVGMHPTPALAQVLASQGGSRDVVPELVRALGLPDAARAHLLAEEDLFTAEDANTVEPSGSVAGAVAGAVIELGRTIAATRTPRRRLWGAIGAAVWVPLAVSLLVLLVRDLVDGREVSWLTWLRSTIALLSLPFAAAAIPHWWRLRGTGQRDASTVPAGFRPGISNTRLGRWLNQRGPSTAACLVLALGFAGIGFAIWGEEAVLRDHGIEVTARVISVDDDITLIEFTDSSGAVIRTHLDSFTPSQPGQTVTVVFDPDDPESVLLAAELRDPLGYIILGGAVVTLLVLAGLTWARAIDWQRVATWLY